MWGETKHGVQEFKYIYLRVKYLFERFIGCRKYFKIYGAYIYASYIRIVPLQPSLKSTTKTLLYHYYDQIGLNDLQAMYILIELN